jgi:hypothetical protein
MTSYAGVNSEVQDYINWIDLALFYNPDTSFFIGNPYMLTGPILATGFYDSLIEKTGQDLFEDAIEPLREAYPDTDIFFLNYGKTASNMKGRFEGDNLPGITEMVGRGDNALFSDATLGHAGPMIRQVSAFTWLDHLYGAQVETIVSYSTFDKTSVIEITNEVMEYNKVYLPADGNDTEDGDSSASSNGFCFPESMTVNVLHQDATPLRDLKIGDLVMVDLAGRYEPVYSFGHYDLDASHKYIQLRANNNMSLELSASHMVMVMDQAKTRAVPAARVTPGDVLLSLDHGSVVVDFIQTVTRQGAFAPFTASGTIVVNGIMASNYISLQTGSSNFYIGTIETPLTHQWLEHSFQFPHRVTCHYLSKCTGEKYDESGISKWASHPFHAAQWLLSQDHIFVLLFMIPVTVVLSAFAVIEWIVTVLVGIFGF